MNGPSLEHEFGSITIGAFDRQNLLRNLVVQIPREVESAVQSTPRIEGPIHTAPPSLRIDDEGGSAVARPSIVAAHLHHAHFRRQSRARVLELRGGNADADGLTRGDRR